MKPTKQQQFATLQFFTTRQVSETPFNSAKWSQASFYNPAPQSTGVPQLDPGEGSIIVILRRLSRGAKWRAWTWTSTSMRFTWNWPHMFGRNLPMSERTNYQCGCGWVIVNCFLVFVIVFGSVLYQGVRPWGAQRARCDGMHRRCQARYQARRL